MSITAAAAILGSVVAQSRPGSDGAGFIGFAVVAAIFIAGVILYRSLRHHLGKVNFEQRPPDVRADPDPPAEDPLPDR